MRKSSPYGHGPEEGKELLTTSRAYANIKIYDDGAHTKVRNSEDKETHQRERHTTECLRLNQPGAAREPLSQSFTARRRTRQQPAACENRFRDRRNLPSTRGRSHTSNNRPKRNTQKKKWQIKFTFRRGLSVISHALTDRPRRAWAREAESENVSGSAATRSQFSPIPFCAIVRRVVPGIPLLIIPSIWPIVRPR